MAARRGVGDIFVQRNLAETLRTIAKQGAKGFYEGPVAADMVATLRAFGGLHTEADFAAGRTARRVRRADPCTLEGLRRLAMPAERVRACSC